MSLLIPNQSDWKDAHGNEEQDELYKQHWLKISKELDNYWQFSPALGFFKQSNVATDDMGFNYATQCFGIETSWEETMAKFQELNNQDPNKKYKLLFLSRHGQGFHNVASAKYSKQEWFDKWRHIGTDGEITWGPDAKLTERGIEQARENNQVWKQQLSLGAPIPSKFYVSPLTRSIDTMMYTWEGVDIPNPIVVDNLRETIGVHLCHKRQTKTEISSKYPTLKFEKNFPEEDQLFARYTPNRESLYQQFLRINDFLQRLFDDEDSCETNNDVVSITSHAGTIRAFITVIGHRKFTICTGGMIPIVVCGERKFKT